MRSCGNGKMNPMKLRKFIGRRTSSVKKTTDPEHKKTVNPEYLGNENSPGDTSIFEAGYPSELRTALSFCWGVCKVPLADSPAVKLIK